MQAEEIRDEICALALSDKLLLVEDIWDSIAKDNGELPMPEWQKQELDKRYQSFKDGEQELRDWQSVHEELRIL